MSTQTVSIAEYCRTVARSAREASRQLAVLTGGQRDQALKVLAEKLRTDTAAILEANAQDLEAARSRNLSSAMTDRLRLNPDRLAGMAQAVEEIRALPDPIGEVMRSSVRPNGLEVQKVRVPLGVVFFIYESRPNVTTDAAALCLKSANAIILRGGSEARHSNTALGRLIRGALVETGIPESAVTMVEMPDREAVGEFLSLADFIDVAIPRGGEALIRRVAQEARMPVIKHYKGVCHVYIDGEVDQEMAIAITENAKCQRPGVCNAAETLLVHQKSLPILEKIAARLLERGVELRGCRRTRAVVPRAREATEDDYYAEFLDLILAVRVVDSLDEAVEHITKYGSGHTETIVTDRLDSARRFAASVDSSAVLVNASTRFNDGGQFGLGAEIGISTDKFHARGPCGLAELTSYKYVVYGHGQIRT